MKRCDFNMSVFKRARFGNKVWRCEPRNRLYVIGYEAQATRLCVIAGSSFAMICINAQNVSVVCCFVMLPGGLRVEAEGTGFV